jgi:hypothetical protein
MDSVHAGMLHSYTVPDMEIAKSRLKLCEAPRRDTGRKVSRSIAIQELVEAGMSRLCRC